MSSTTQKSLVSEYVLLRVLILNRCTSVSENLCSIRIPNHSDLVYPSADGVDELRQSCRTEVRVDSVM